VLHPAVLQNLSLLHFIFQTAANAVVVVELCRSFTLCFGFPVDCDG